MVANLNTIRSFKSDNVVLTLGSATGRRMVITLPKVIFALPSIAVPATGTIPVSFTGTAYQTANDAADEIKVEFL